MKIYRLAFVVLACLSLLSPLTAAASVAEEAFLRSLAETANTPQIEESPDGFGIPAPALRTCSISRSCGDGNTVACTGNESCANSQRGVKCDTTEYACPNYCSMSWKCGACPTYTFFCWSLKGDCGVTAAGCDGRQKLCLCPSQPEW